MNFLFFPGGSYVGGMEIVIQSLMAQLNAMGHRTLAIISGWNDGDYPSRLEANGLSFEEIKLGRFYRSKPLWTLDTLRNLPAAALRLRRCAKEFRPDTAIYPDPQLLLIGSLILPKLPNVLYHRNDARACVCPELGNDQCTAGSHRLPYRIWRPACATPASRRRRLPSCTTASRSPQPSLHSQNAAICLGIVGRSCHANASDTDQALELLRTRRPANSVSPQDHRQR